MAVYGAAGLASSRMLAVNRVKSASLAASRPDPRAASRCRSVAASERTQTRRTVPPPRSATQARHRRASWICWVNGPDSTTGQPCERIWRAVDVMPAYSWTLMCSSYHGPSRSPAGRPAAAQRRCHERPVHRVLVQQRRRRHERGEQDARHRALTGPGRARPPPRRARGLSCPARIWPLDGWARNIPPPSVLGQILDKNGALIVT